MLDVFVSTLEEAARDDDAAKAAAAPATALEVLLFFLFLFAPALLAFLLIEGGNFEFRQVEVNPARVHTSTTVAPAAPVSTAAATTSTSIEVVQPPTEVIEGPAPGPAPAPETSAAPPHGG